MHPHQNYFELSMYTGRPLELVYHRCQYAPYELAWQWPLQTDTLQFYRDSEMYLFDLTLYGDLLENRGTYTWFQYAIQHYGFKKLLDFGGGIGGWTIKAYEAGAECDYLDVEGVMSKYAKWRFDRRSLTPKMMPETEDFGTYDAIVIFDVLEHVENPEPLIKKLAEKTEYIFCNPEEIPYNEIYPMHISHFDLTPYFTKVDRYLWKSRFSPSVSSAEMKKDTSVVPLNPSRSFENWEGRLLS